MRDFVLVPDVGFKILAKCTSADLRARQDYTLVQARGLAAESTWCGRIADVMDAAGVSLVQELSELPPFPDVDELDLAA